MDRTAMKQLEAWKTSRNRKPLIIRGARQTGKTWLSEEFGRTRYEAVARIDLMNDERARSFFDGDLDVSRILRNISSKQVFLSRQIPWCSLMRFKNVRVH